MEYETEIFARDLKTGMHFTYDGAFVIYEATSPAKFDPSYPGRVVLHAQRQRDESETVDLRIRLRANQIVRLWR